MYNILERKKNSLFIQQMGKKNTYKKLSELTEKLKSTNDPKRKYEYILWLGNKLKEPKNEIFVPENKVKGCVSEVFIKGYLVGNRITWEGYSDALITKGLLSFLIAGLSDLTPSEIIELNEDFIKDTGLKGSLTPSRANGFLNIFLKMKSEANNLFRS